MRAQNNTYTEKGHYGQHISEPELMLELEVRAFNAVAKQSPKPLCQ